MSQELTLKSFLIDISKSNNKPVFKHRKEFHTETYTFDEIMSTAKKVQTFFAENDIKQNDKVLICSNNSPHWVSLLFGCALSGVILVPIDKNSNIDFIENIKNTVEAKAIFIEKYKLIVKKDRYLVLEDFIDTILNLNEYDQKVDISENNLLQIIYTSGTTSEPKGVMLTNKNIMSNLKSIENVVPKNKEYSFLSVLPLSHTYEQMLGLYLPMYLGGTITYTPNLKQSTILEIMNQERVNTIISVPEFLKTFMEKIQRDIEGKGKTNKFNRMIKFAESRPMAFRRILFRKILNRFGDLEIFAVGGASLDIEVEKFWRSMGVHVLQGYGMTEASPLITTNTFWENKVGTVGKIIAKQEIKILEDKEIITKGNNVTSGYYEDSEETNKILKDNWLYTGDLGEIDTEGYLKIVGRKKNMILSSSGLNVYPEDIEKAINISPKVKDSCVLGIESDTDTIITAIILLNGDIDRIDENNFAKEINKKLSPHQYIQNVIIWDEPDFPRTHTLKVKRMEIYEAVVDDKIKIDNSTSNDELINILKIVCPNNSKIGEENLLVNDLGLDSLNRVELVSLIEDEYNVYVEEGKINNETKVTDLRKIIDSSQKIGSNTDILKFNTSNIVTLVRTILQPIFFSTLKYYTNPDVVGKENLNKIDLSKPTIFVSNHTSHMDTYAILESLPSELRIKTAVASAKDYHFKKFFLRIFVQIILNGFPFSRGSEVYQSIKLLGRFVDNGYGILIYPEGTRTTTGEIQPFKSGIGLIAQNLNANIVPIHVNGLYTILPKGKNWPSKGNSMVVFGKPFKVDKKVSILEATKKIKNQVMKLDKGQ